MHLAFNQYIVGSSPYPFAKCPGNSVEECFATNEEVGGSNPSQGAISNLNSNRGVIGKWN